MDEFLQTLESAHPNACADEAERVKTIDTLFAALRRFQRPFDVAWDHSWVAPLTHSAIRTLIDAGVFTAWDKAGGGTKSSAELAKLTGTDPVLIKRLVRHVAAQHLLTEVGEDAYAPTAWSEALARDATFPAAYGQGFYYDLSVGAYQSLPAYLSRTGFRNPTSATDGNFQQLVGHGTDYFAYATARPPAEHEFNAVMECRNRHHLQPWVDVYPTAEEIVAAARPGRAWVVDVGGGRGHDLERFRARHAAALPAGGGALVLQDRPGLAEDVVAALDPAIAFVAHDFFAPQPVRGARAYYLHSVLHDWHDDDAVRILARLAAALEPGYSRVLIHESVVSAVRPQARVTTADLTMMAILSAKERTEAEFENLLAAAGLRVRKVWRAPHSPESIIEAELA